MTSHSVREVSLLIHTPACSARTIRQDAEYFVAQVLEQFGDCLERRFPGQIVMIRELPLNWRLTDKRLHSAAVLSELAERLASSVSVGTWSSLTPPPEHEPVIRFADEAHWRACFLVASVRYRCADAWFFRPLVAEGGPWAPFQAGFVSRDTPQPHALFAQNILLRLAETEQLRPVLTEATIIDLQTITQTLGVDDRPCSFAANDSIDSLERSGGLQTATSRTLITSRSGLEQAILTHIESLTSHAVNVNGAWAVHPTSLADSDSRGVVDARHSPSDVFVPSDVAQSTIMSDISDSGATSTRFGGLFYLLKVALELDLGEILWQACLPERTVLSHAAATVLGGAGRDDAAPWFFGGVSPLTSLPLVSAEQQAEIGTSLLSSLVQAIPRRGLASWPAVRLAVVSTSQGRLLTSTSEQGFLIFACPVATAEDLGRALSKFLACWPTSAPAPEASHELERLDISGRLSCSLSSMPPGKKEQVRRQERQCVARLFAETSSENPCITYLRAQIAGTLSCLFAARLQDKSCHSNRQLVEDYFRQPGQLICDRDTLLITIPVSSIDLSVRKGGLDQDPGWIPWLNLTGRFSFDQEA